jgi:hypothetical protein
MKSLTFYLLTILFVSFISIGCRDIFGDRTQTESIVQAPEENSNLVVTEPVYGKIWNPGDTLQIKWIAPTIKSIDLELYRKDEFKFAITVNTANHGNYLWIIPMDLPLSNHYLIKVINHNNDAVYKFSSRFGIQ